LKKTLLIIGAGIEQVPAYELAKNRGFKIIGTDLDLNAPALKLADHVLNVSTKDAEKTASAAVCINHTHRIDGVMTIANDVPYTVALVANKLGLRSISLDAAKCASNKLIMKNAFKENKVPCPWFCEILTFDDLKFLLDTAVDETFVLKPIDGSGARGVLLIDRYSDLEWCYNESLKWGQSGKLILEKFIKGVQLSTESFILNGVCYTPGISERNYSKINDYKPYIIEDGGTIPAMIDDILTEKISSIILKGAASMGIDEGIIKGDLVIDQNGEPLIIELAARLSGGWFSTHQIPAATGVDLVNAVMSSALGLTVNEDELLPKFSKATAVRYFFPPEGKILSIKGFDEVSTSKGVMKCDLFRKVGDFQPKVLKHPDRFGYVLVSAEARMDALNLVSNAMSKLNIEIETQ
jgi:biotin carboxylase